MIYLRRWHWRLKNRLKLYLANRIRYINGFNVWGVTGREESKIISPDGKQIVI